MKVIDTKEYIMSLLELAEQGQEVPLMVAGGSMAPFIAGGRDEVCFIKPDRRPKRGDIVLFRRKDGRFVLHRVHHAEGENYYIIGDAQSVMEGPVPPENICGIVTKVRRKGKWYTPEDGYWRFFSRVWIRIIPLRAFIMRIYSKLKKGTH